MTVGKLFEGMIDLQLRCKHEKLAWNHVGLGVVNLCDRRGEVGLAVSRMTTISSILLIPGMISTELRQA